MNEKQEILDAKGHDSALFYKLVNKHRSKPGVHINELHVGDATFKSEQEILDGWKKHFGELATQSSNPCFDEKYRAQIEQELIEIIDICDSTSGQHDEVTEKEMEDALSSLNKGKAPDIYGLTTEHLTSASEVLLPVLTSLMNRIFSLGDLPDSLKLGMLTPVFKKKGSNLDAKNYRGITILPILSKVLESILRTRIEPNVERTQNSMQRGFTKHSSPMNCSLILEEYIRENKDLKKDTYIAFLDAKAAFDVVHHPSMMRKLFHIGVEGVTWNLIYSLHRRAQTVVRWCDQTSEPFEILQGVRQGGVLSTDLYKVYSNPLLDRVTELLTGGMVGGVCCAAPACADDVTFTSDKPDELQVLVSESEDYSGMERFLLQPVKSVVMPVPGIARKTTNLDQFSWTINGEKMPVVKEVTHMGIKRSAVSNDVTVDENIKKARKTMYSLMGPGLHGYNGLDPETSVQLYQVYVVPTLVYGLELILPEQRLVDSLERTNKKFLKHILSLPNTTADSAVYILTGTIPVEGVIHKRALSLFGNVCRQEKNSTEQRLATRQLTVKSSTSNSWFIAIKKLLVKYGLPEPVELLGNPQTKCAWKHRVNKHVNQFWTSVVKSRAALYPSLEYLVVGNYACGRIHHLLKSCKNAREVHRVHTKLKIATGTYILQTKRASFNQNEVDPTCMMCRNGDETMQHFLLQCPVLSEIRDPVMNSIVEACSGLCNPATDTDTLLELIIDCSAKVDIHNHGQKLSNIESLSRRLCFALNCERFKRLALIPRRNRTVLKNKK